jgi:nitroreductase
VRRRLDLGRPVEPALIEECLRVAQQAPSASNIQNWHFVVVTDAEKRRALADLS